MLETVIMSLWCMSYRPNMRRQLHPVAQSSHKTWAENTHHLQVCRTAGLYLVTQA